GAGAAGEVGDGVGERGLVVVERDEGGGQEAGGVEPAADALGQGGGPAAGLGVAGAGGLAECAQGGRAERLQPPAGLLAHGEGRAAELPDQAGQLARVGGGG